MAVNSRAKKWMERGRSAEACEILITITIPTTTTTRTFNTTSTDDRHQHLNNPSRTFTTAVTIVSPTPPRFLPVYLGLPFTHLLPAWSYSRLSIFF